MSCVGHRFDYRFLFQNVQVMGIHEKDEKLHTFHPHIKQSCRDKILRIPIEREIAMHYIKCFRFYSSPAYEQFLIVRNKLELQMWHRLIDNN